MTEQDLVKLDLTNSFAMYTGVYRSWQAYPYRVRLFDGKVVFSPEHLLFC